jgi:lysophospholipase L1-like esterase
VEHAGVRFLPLILLVGCMPVPEEAPTEPPPADVPIEEPPPTGTWVPESFDPRVAERILFLGDSITAGGGASTATLNYRNLLVDNDGDTWPEYAARDLATLAPDLLDVHDVSRGGATTATMVRYQLDNLRDAVGPTVAGPSVAVLTAGGNDMQLALASFLAQGEEFAAERVDLLIDNLHETIDMLTDADRFPDGTMVYLSNIYEPTDGIGQVDGCFGGLDLVDMMPMLDDANQRIRALAEERGVAVIDLRQHFRGHAFYADDPENPDYHPDDPTRWIVDDCIHPNDRGHHELRRLFFGAMEGELLPRP